MAFITENVRLRELVAIVNINQAFFEDFDAFLRANGYAAIMDFVADNDDTRALQIIMAYLARIPSARLYDGVGKPYEHSKAVWYFLSWLFRDAPAQRLGPLVSQMAGSSTIEKQARLLNEIRRQVAPLFPRADQWQWPAIAEVILSRLEGSRRALRGTLFEGIVRRCLESLFKKHKLALRIGDKEVRINDETYDVQVYGKTSAILLPVKTRETMGGGHALLFTRDIFKSISVAETAGYVCIPVVIAESWGGKLNELDCKHFVYIQANPNQINRIEPILFDEFERLIPVFKSILE